MMTRTATSAQPDELMQHPSADHAGGSAVQGSAAQGCDTLHGPGHVQLLVLFFSQV